MKLLLLDAYKAGLFGLPAEDSTVEAALDFLRQGHPAWPDDAIKNHLEAAIASGAFTAEESAEIAKEG